ncbi:hypothetical protein AAG906_024681 [Vitis piasezkii]
MEGLKTNSTALAALAVSCRTLFLFSECDIRSCLNTLRFLNKKNQTLNVVRNDVFVVLMPVHYHLAFSLGLPEWNQFPSGRSKDMSRSIFDIGKRFFEQKNEASKKIDNCYGGMSNGFNFHALSYLIGGCKF